MASVLSCIHSIRALVESGDVQGPVSVTELFSPLLQLLVKEGGPSLDQMLVDMFSERLLNEKVSLPMDLNRGLRRELEKRAQPYCSAGDLDALPQNVICHAISFLDYDDRMPLECVCRSMFVFSRNTPILVPCVLSSKMYDFHITAPNALWLNSLIPEERLVCLNTTWMSWLVVREGADTTSLMSKPFPFLKICSYRSVEIDRVISDHRIWDFVSKHKVRHLTIEQCGHISVDHWNALTDLLYQHHVSGLFLANTTLEPQSAMSKPLELEYLLFKDCHLHIQLLQSLINPDLHFFRFSGGTIHSRNGYSPDWSFFNLPKLNYLYLECCGCLTLKALSSIIDNYGPVWKNIWSARFAIGQCQSTELCAFLQRCSILPIQQLSLSISNFQPGDPSVEMPDICDILSQFPLLNKLLIHCEAVDSQSEESFHRMMVWLYRLNLRSQVKVELIVNDSGILDRFQQLCTDAQFAIAVRQWVKVMPSFDLFGYT